jgi:hypothetical protein
MINMELEPKVKLAASNSNLYETKKSGGINILFLCTILLCLVYETTQVGSSTFI